MSSTTSQSLAASALRAYKRLLLDSHGHELPQDIPQSAAHLRTSISPSFSRAAQRIMARARCKEEQLRQRWRDGKLQAREQYKAYATRALGLMTLWHARGATQQHQGAASKPPAPILDDVPGAVSDQQQGQQIASRPLTQEQRDSILGADGWLRYGILSGIANLSHAFMHGANSVTVEGGHHMRAALSRPTGQALITVCNHVAAMDDPLVMSAIIPTEFYQQPSALRWTLCASDRCFKYAALSPLFTAAKVLPIQRGAGLQQPGMVAAEERLAQGDWVHIFPEGTRSRDPHRMGSVRKGVGRLIAAACTDGAPPPLVVPFVHAGMEQVMPVGSSLPRVGQEVKVLVGEPIPVEDLMAVARTARWSNDALYTAIAQRVEQRLHHMHAVVRGEATLGASTADAMQLPSTADCLAGAGAQLSMSEGSAVRADYVAQGRQIARSAVLAYNNWEAAAFNTWHRVWSQQLAAVQASEGLYYS